MDASEPGSVPDGDRSVVTLRSPGVSLARLGVSEDGEV